MMLFEDAAAQVMARCDELGNISQSLQHLDRRYLTEQHRHANQLVAHWMAETEMDSWVDAAGNVWGRYASDVPDAPRLILGSHLDTVPNGGRYDGMLGVVAPISLLAILKGQQVKLPFHVDVVGFGDEEGTRFGSTLLGSRALTGTWPDEWAKLTDSDGKSLAKALLEFGLDFSRIKEAAIAPAQLLGYVELHIEQGPVLEQQNLAVGVVSGIAGARRFEIALSGMAGHAGTVPMNMRQDALCAASEMILCVEQLAIQHALVATVGKISNRPNGVNVIAGNTSFSLDIRSESDALRDATVDEIFTCFQQIAQRRGVSLQIQQTHSAPAVLCSEFLQQNLRNAVAGCGYPVLTLPSGAGHDAMAMADICPVAMLFTRCHRGISHHPDEAIRQDDVAVSLQVLHRFLTQLKF
ncbi:allantoate amidohydrolase [Alteromonas aestuariivivens]|uniref:Allantoate amidohydrolase n=1 Tax=Alteromonas aestuariivivens TaxID=1938339 RepID=A0A3D8MBX0_9ALTE|nr:allantoate amidohydrolase [Alteromonas aestuariivivens]RDV27526.1 allantoate amidohydrolase [Alteromonas aestuariivivens]